ncbi:MAG: Bug family tripartite tricarboxylate transporter substrate binding protein [Burkholderiales bacterium]
MDHGLQAYPIRREDHLREHSFTQCAAKAVVTFVSLGLHRGLVRSVLLAIALPALSVAATAHAQTGAPVKIFVGFPAGGTIDYVARLLAEKMKDDLGAPVVVENRTGAGGQIAAQAVKQAAPDGKTLMLANDHTMVIVPLTHKNPGFDPVKDFTPIGLTSTYLVALAVASSTGAKDVAASLAWARANPAQANVGIPAAGSIAHFMLGSLSRDAKVPLTTVPYRGSAPLVQDLASGQVVAGMTAMGDFLELEKAGRLRVIAVVDPRRAPQLPAVPTFVEQGYKFEWNLWLGMFGPANTPAPVVARVNAALAKALAQPDVRAGMAKLAFNAAHSSPAALGERVQEGMTYWAPQVKASGWTLQ